MKKILASTAFGAMAGGTVYKAIGGMGLALKGTAIGITLGPMILIGSVSALTIASVVRKSKARPKMAKVYPYRPGTDTYEL